MQILLGKRCRFLAGSLAALAVAGSIHASELAGSAPESKTYDLWVRNGTVIDGTGAARVAADVLVTADTIEFVGSTAGRNVKARKTIDARGKIVTPGYIDLHSHGDPLTESFVNFLAQGITTVVLGQDGNTAIYESFREPALAAWRAAGRNPQSDAKTVATLAQWMQRVDARGSEVNIATLSGHGSLRAIAGVGEAPQPTAEQMSVMKEILQADLAAGAFGMSFGLEYSPGRYSQAAEQKALGDVVGKRGGIVMSHMRSEDFDKIGAAIDELLQIDAHVHVSHIKIVAGKRAEEANAILDQFARARARGKTVTADVYPYLASASSLHFLYPEWARGESQYQAAVKNRRAELEAHLRKRVEERNGPQAILFVDGPHSGQRLSQIAEQLHKPYEKVIIDDIGYGGPAQAHFLMSEAVQSVFINADHIGICTDGSPEPGHPRSAGSFVKVLEEYVGAPPKMSFERAVYKMSGLAAEILGLDRGVLSAGRKADIIVLSPDQLHSRATWTESALRPSGLDVIVVNGKIAYESGQPVGRNGRIVKRARRPPP
jgi:N-acyl-D-amino-acid deacylase